MLVLHDVSILVRCQKIQPVVIADEVIILRGHSKELRSSGSNGNKAIRDGILVLQDDGNFTRAGTHRFGFGFMDIFQCVGHPLCLLFVAKWIQNPEMCRVELIPL